MSKKRLIVVAVLIFFIIIGYSVPQVINSLPPKSEQNSKIEVEMRFSTYDSNGAGIEGVELILVGYDGEVIDILKSNSNGEARKKITVQLDNRYSNTVKDELGPKGTITVLAYKDGYRESVLFEAGVSEGNSSQRILMNPLIEGQRNEPEVYLGNNHHLEIISLVNKYGKLIGKKAHN